MDKPKYPINWAIHQFFSDISFILLYITCYLILHIIRFIVQNIYENVQYIQSNNWFRYIIIVWLGKYECLQICMCNTVHWDKLMP